MRGGVLRGVERRVRCGVQLRRDARRSAGLDVECRARCGVLRGVGDGVEDDAVRGEVGWEEAKMACEITSDAILPI